MFTRRILYDVLNLTSLLPSRGDDAFDSAATAPTLAGAPSTASLAAENAQLQQQLAVERAGAGELRRWVGELREQNSALLARISQLEK